MTEREFFSLIRRQGYDHVPYGYQMRPDLARRFSAWRAESGFEPHHAPRVAPPCRGRERP